MKTIEMKLQAEPFEAIVSGEKKIELRLYDEKRKVIECGDIIIFTKEPEKIKSIKTRVVALLHYPSFSELFDDIPLDIFGEKTKQELLRTVSQFYPESEQKKYGVLGIRIEPVI